MRESARLGKTTIRTARLGFGCAAIGGYDYGTVSDQNSVAAIHAALDHGITFFDTADIYGFGHAESILGKALARRDARDLIVATKVGVREVNGRTQRDLSPRYIRAAVEESLRRLRRERIELYQIHWPDPNTPLSATIEALIRLQHEGKVLHLGCCNFETSLVEQAQGVARLETLQLPFSLAERDAETTFSECASIYEMTGLAYNALAQGFFSGKYTRDAMFEGTDLRRQSPLFRGATVAKNERILAVLREIASDHGCSPAQVAIRWVLDRRSDVLVIAGMKNETQLRQNVEALEWTLNSTELALLDEQSSEHPQSQTK